MNVSYRTLRLITHSAGRYPVTSSVARVKRQDGTVTYEVALMADEYEARDIRTGFRTFKEALAFFRESTSAL